MRAALDTARRLGAAAALAPGRGRLDLFAFGVTEGDRSRAGGGLDYAHRVSGGISLVGAATAGIQSDRGRSARAYAEAVIGLRGSW